MQEESAKVPELLLVPGLATQRLIEPDVQEKTSLSRKTKNGAPTLH